MAPTSLRDRREQWDTTQCNLVQQGQVLGNLMRAHLGPRLSVSTVKETFGEEVHAAPAYLKLRLDDLAAADLGAQAQAEWHEHPVGQTFPPHLVHPLQVVLQ